MLPQWHLRRPQDAPSWLISFGLHGALLLVLGMIFTESVSEAISTIIHSAPDVSVGAEPVIETLSTSQIGVNSAVDGDVDGHAVAAVAMDTPGHVVRVQIDEEGLGPVGLQLPAETELPDAKEMAGTISTQGAPSTENPGNTAGALDRLAFEIAASLREHKTLVVWLFDASLSLKARRDAIADRFEKVYEQLEALEVTADRALQTAVASYGERTKLLTANPIDDIKAIKDAVRNIKPDESGLENVFAAVERVTRLWQPYCQQSRRKMMVLIVTDERGNDFEKMEPVIHFTRRHGIRCYVVGNAAPFGREKGYVRWTYPDGGSEDLEVDQGPETFAPETLNLAMWGGNSRAQARLSSGFGPYALTRLCAETGGIFLIADDNASASAERFDHEVMRNYLPDYGTARDYQAQLQRNKAKGALVDASLRTALEAMPHPQTFFRADNDTNLRRALTEAQKPIANVDYKLGEMQDILSKGEKDRAKLSQPRWQAGYDLAMGRTLAMRARTLGYNQTLAEMKSSPKPFERSDSNQWRLVPSDDVTSGGNVKKMADKALEYLRGVISKHPGTPWALLAERELRQPLGWQWKEGKMPLTETAAKTPKKKLLLADEETPQKQQKKAPAAPRQKPQL